MRLGRRMHLAFVPCASLLTGGGRPIDPSGEPRPFFSALIWATLLDSSGSVIMKEAYEMHFINPSYDKCKSVRMIIIFYIYILCYLLLRNLIKA